MKWTLMSLCVGWLSLDGGFYWPPGLGSWIWWRLWMIESPVVPWPDVFDAGLLVTWLGLLTCKFIWVSCWIVSCGQQVDLIWVWDGGNRVLIEWLWVVVVFRGVWSVAYCWSSNDSLSESSVSAKSPYKMALLRRRHNWVSGVLGSLVSIENFVSEMQGVTIDVVTVLFKIKYDVTVENAEELMLLSNE